MNYSLDCFTYIGSEIQEVLKTTEMEGLMLDRTVSLLVL